MTGPAQRRRIAWLAHDYLRDAHAGGVLPAFVVGVEPRDLLRGPLPPDEGDPRRRRVDVALTHQYGGDACLNTALYGMVLSLRDNLDAADPRAAALFEALWRRAESSGAANSERAVLPLPTRPRRTGDAMTAPELRAVHEAIDGRVRVPGPVRGWEALIDLGPVADDWLEGRVATVFAVREDGYASPVGTRRLPARSLGPRHHPRLWLLWENCD